MLARERAQMFSDTGTTNTLLRQRFLFGSKFLINTSFDLAVLYSLLETCEIQFCCDRSSVTHVSNVGILLTPVNQKKKI